MYVAITRAEKVLFLTESEGYNYATGSNKYPSRFISEIGDNLIKIEGEIDTSLIFERDNIISQLDKEIEEHKCEISEGDVVLHKLFGEGTVISVNVSNQSCKVDFNGKIKNILYRFLTIKENN